MVKYIFLVLGLLLIPGCQTPTLYSWGHYEQLLYGMYSSPDKITPELQLEKLTEDLELATAKGVRMPPGFYAHLGFLYYQTGQMEQAREAFEIEKKHFPESTTLMDRFINDFNS